MILTCIWLILWGYARLQAAVTKAENRAHVESESRATNLPLVQGQPLFFEDESDLLHTNTVPCERNSETERLNSCSEKTRHRNYGATGISPRGSQIDKNDLRSNASEKGNRLETKTNAIEPRSDAAKSKHVDFANASKEEAREEFGRTMRVAISVAWVNPQRGRRSVASLILVSQKLGYFFYACKNLSMC